VGDSTGGTGLANGRAAAHRRWLMLGLGWVFFALGAVGMVLPLLPTTPFMLLALWAFSIGSERFHAWLYHHPVFGPPLRRWQEERIIPLWGKAVAVSSMLASFLWAWLATDAPWYGLAATAVVMAAGVAYISRFPSRRSQAPRAPAPGARP
jgi:uncharacterized membrane protein YbaN (DUF454 family)